MDGSVQSPMAGVADGAPFVGAFVGALAGAFVGAFAGAPELDGPPWFGVADAVASLEDADEHAVSMASPVPP